MSNGEPPRQPGGGQGTWRPTRKGSKGPELQQMAKSLGLDKPPEGEVAEVESEFDDPNKQPNLEPSTWEPADQFEWRGDEETFTFDRLVYGDEPLEDQCTIHEGFTIRLRSLTSGQVSDMGAGVGIQQLRANPMQIRDQNTFGTLARSLIRVGDHLLEEPDSVAELDNKKQPVKFGVDVNEEWLRKRPDTLVALLGQVYMEFSSRLERIGRRGKLGNFSGPPSESSEPSDSRIASTEERSGSGATP